MINYHSELRRRKRRMVDAIKEASPCMDCGGFFPAVCMDFDHTDDNKLDNVSRAVTDKWSNDRILAEIAKCDIVCANCHRIRSQTRAVAVPLSPKL